MPSTLAASVRGVLLLALILGAVTTTAPAQSIQEIGLPDGYAQLIVRGMSPDGRVVAGNVAAGTAGPASFVFRDGQFRMLASDGTPGVYDVSNGEAGQEVAVGGQPFGQFNAPRAVRWLDTPQSQDLPVPNAESSSEALAVNADGSVIVGDAAVDSKVRAARWVNGQYENLGALDASSFGDSKAYGVSTDGSVIVGTTPTSNGQVAFRWEDSTMTALPCLAANCYASAHAVSADGLTVVGTANDGTIGNRATVWRDGVAQSLGTMFSANERSYAWSVSGDGSIITGTIDPPTGNDVTFVWTAEKGMRTLADFLWEDYAIDSGGWTYLYQVFVSDDGETLAGTRINGNVYGGYVARLFPAGFTAPTEDEIVPPGEPYTVEFAAPEGADLVNLFMVRTIDPNGPRELVAEGISASGGVYEWNVPEDLRSPSTYLYVVDAANDQSELRSERFRIRHPWVLTRIAGSVAAPEYEEFFYDLDAWQFAQSEETLWPVSYWNYTNNAYSDLENGFDENIEPYGEVRYDPEYFGDAETDRQPTWNTMVRAFGQNATYSSDQPIDFTSFKINDVNLWAANVWRWTAGVGYRESGFQGSCFGMSVGMMAAFGNPDAFSNYWLGNQPLDRLADVQLGDGLRDVIHAMQLYQKTTAQDRREKENILINKVTPREVVEDLKEMFERDQRLFDRALLFRSDLQQADEVEKGAAHAVAPVGMVRHDGGIYDIIIFDPNEGPRQAYVRVDSAANSWTHSDPAWHGGVGTGLYLSMTADEVLKRGITTWPYTFTSGKNSGKNNPIAPETKGDQLVADEYVTVRFAGSGSRVVGTSGDISYADGSVTQTLDDAFARYAYTGYPSDPYEFVLAPGTYTAEVTATARGTAALQVESGRVALGYRRASGTASETDAVALGNETISLSPGSDGVVALSAIASVGSSARMFTADGLTAANAGSAALSLVDDTSAVQISSSASGSYNLILDQSGPDGRGSFFHRGVAIAAGATHTVRPVWSALNDSTVTIDIDTDGDGSTDDTIVVTNEGYPVANETLVGPEWADAIGLSDVWPNPSSGIARVGLTLDQKGSARVTVHDALGRELAVVAEGERAPGRYEFAIDTKSLASGVYFVRLTAGRTVQTKKLIVAH